MLGRIHHFVLVCFLLLVASCSSGGGGNSQSSENDGSSSRANSAKYTFEEVYANPWNYSESDIKSVYLELVKEQYPGSFELTEIPVEDLWDFYTVLRGSAGYLKIDPPDIRNPRNRAQLEGGWDMSEEDPLSQASDAPLDDEHRLSIQSIEEAGDGCPFMASPIDLTIAGYMEDGSPIWGSEAQPIDEYVLAMNPLEQSGTHLESCLDAGSMEIKGLSTVMPSYAAVEFNRCDHETMRLDGSMLVGLFEFSGETNAPGHLFGVLDSTFDIDSKIESLSYRRGYFYNQFERSDKPFAGCGGEGDSDFEPSAQTWSSAEAATGYLLEAKVLEGGEVVTYSNQSGIYFSSEENDWFLVQESSRQVARSSYPDVQHGRIGIAEFGTLDFSWHIAEEGLPYPMINEIGRYTFSGKSGERAIFSWNDYSVIRIILDDGVRVRGLYASPKYEQFASGRPSIASDMLAPLSQLSHPPVLPFFVSLAHDVDQGLIVAEHMEAITDPDNDDSLLQLEYRWFVNDQFFTATAANAIAVNTLPEDTQTLSLEIFASDGINQVKHRVAGFMTARGDGVFQLR